MFRGMEYVYEVYREKSFSGAAKNLYLSQPALSNSIKRIEDRIGAPLFDRSTAPIRLTDVGREYIHAAEQIMSIEENFSHYLADTQNLKTGRLSIGSGALFTSYILPGLIAPFKEAHPYVEVQVVESNTVELQQLLSEGSIDLMLENRSLTGDFSSVPLGTEHVILAVPRRWEINSELLAWQQSPENIVSGRYLGQQFPVVPLERFRELPFVSLSPEDDSHSRALQLCQKHGFTPRIVMTLNQQLTSYNVACEGLGASIVSDTLVKSTPQGGKVIYYKLDSELSERQICFYYKKNRYLSKPVSVFLQSAVSGNFPAKK